jgi:hypothetical protein
MFLQGVKEEKKQKKTIKCKRRKPKSKPRLKDIKRRDRRSL